MRAGGRATAEGTVTGQRRAEWHSGGKRSGLASTYFPQTRVSPPPRAKRSRSRPPAAAARRYPWAPKVEAADVRPGGNRTTAMMKVRSETHLAASRSSASALGPALLARGDLAGVTRRSAITPARGRSARPSGPRWTMRSGCRRSGARCVTNRIVTLPLKRAMVAAKWSATAWSRPLVASSKIRTRGRFSSARAMAMRCFCPPDRPTPRSPTSVL